MCASLLLSVVFILAGIVLCLLEVLVLPGLIAGLLGLGLIVFGIVHAYMNCGIDAGTWILIGTIVLCVLSVWLLYKSRTWKKLSLKTEVNGRVNELVSGNIQPGDTGVAFNRLGPVGKVKIGDKILDARSIGPYIDPGTEVVVVSLSEQYLIVEPK